MDFKHLIIQTSKESVDIEGNIRVQVTPHVVDPFTLTAEFLTDGTYSVAEGWIDEVLDHNGVTEYKWKEVGFWFRRPAKDEETEEPVFGPWSYVTGYSQLILTSFVHSEEWFRFIDTLAHSLNDDRRISLWPQWTPPRFSLRRQLLNLPYEKVQKILKAANEMREVRIK